MGTLVRIPIFTYTGCSDTVVDSPKPFDSLLEEVLHAGVVSHVDVQRNDGEVPVSGLLLDLFCRLLDARLVEIGQGQSAGAVARKGERGGFAYPAGCNGSLVFGALGVWGIIIRTISNHNGNT